MNWRPEGWTDYYRDFQSRRGNLGIRISNARAHFEAGADAMLNATCEEIEKVENPYPKDKLASAEYYEGEGFDRACRRILALLRSEK